MSLKTIEITKTFSRWLERYSPPLAIRDKPQAMQDEVDTLVRVLMRGAPAENVGQWVERVLERVSERMTTRAWPTAGEVAVAVRGFAGKSDAAERGERGERGNLSRDELYTLEARVLPTARRWLGIPGLREHAEKTLAHWGEAT